MNTKRILWGIAYGLIAQYLYNRTVLGRVIQPLTNDDFITIPPNNTSQPYPDKPFFAFGTES